MKKILLFIFFTNLCFAQNSELLNTNWQVTKIMGELLPDKTPPPMPQQSSIFSSEPSKLNLLFFNTVSADLTYSGQNQFTVNDKTCTIADFWGVTVK